MVDYIFIAGAPGTGKTTIVNLLRKRLNEPPTIDFGSIRVFHLDRAWKKANKKEEAMSFENLMFILKNYKKKKYKNVIVTDLHDFRVQEIPRRFSRSNYVIATLTVESSELKKRVLGERDSGYKDFKKAIQWNLQVEKRRLLKNEHKIDNTHNKPERTVREILRILKEHK